jgi:hypothetical protein
VRDHCLPEQKAAKLFRVDLSPLRTIFAFVGQICLGKVIAFTLSICILPGGALSRCTDDVRITVSIIEGEHSRDSNSSSTTITIKDNDLVYDRLYAGYGNGKRKPIHQEIELTGQEIDQLEQLISKETVLVSRSMELPTDGAGRYVIVIMNLQMGKKKSAIKVSGMFSRIENETLYKTARALIDEIDRIRDAHGSSISSNRLPKPHAS